MSARFGPTIAEPVSCAIISRRKELGVGSCHGNSASIQNGRPYPQTARSTASERSGVSLTPCAPIGPGASELISSAWKNTDDRIGAACKRASLDGGPLGTWREAAVRRAQSSLQRAVGTRERTFGGKRHESGRAGENRRAEPSGSRQ